MLPLLNPLDNAHQHPLVLFHYLAGFSHTTLHYSHNLSWKFLLPVQFQWDQNSGIKCTKIIISNQKIYPKATLLIKTSLHLQEYGWNSIASRIIWALHRFSWNTKDSCTAEEFPDRVSMNQQKLTCEHDKKKRMNNTWKFIEILTFVAHVSP